MLFQKGTTIQQYSPASHLTPRFCYSHSATTRGTRTHCKKNQNRVWPREGGDSLKRGRANAPKGKTAHSSAVGSGKSFASRCFTAIGSSLVRSHSATSRCCRDACCFFHTFRGKKCACSISAGRWSQEATCRWHSDRVQPPRWHRAQK